MIIYTFAYTNPNRGIIYQDTFRTLDACWVAKELLIDALDLVVQKKHRWSINLEKPQTIHSNSMGWSLIDNSETIHKISVSVQYLELVIEDYLEKN